MPSSHLILCRPLLLPPIPPSIRVFSNESTLPMKWPKYWNFSFSINGLLQNGLVGYPCSPRDSQESSPIQQFKSINSSALSFFHSPTLTSMTLSRWTFVGKVMSLLFNMLSRLVITLLPRSKCLLISWLQWCQYFNLEFYTWLKTQFSLPFSLFRVLVGFFWVHIFIFCTGLWTTFSCTPGKTNHSSLLIVRS